MIVYRGNCNKQYLWRAKKNPHHQLLHWQRDEQQAHMSPLYVNLLHIPACCEEQHMISRDWYLCCVGSLPERWHRTPAETQQLVPAWRCSAMTLVVSEHGETVWSPWKLIEWQAPLLSTFVIQHPLGGRAPLGGKAKGIVLHVQTKQPLASGLSKAPLVTYLCDTSKMGFCYSLSLYTQPHKRCEFIGWELHGRADWTNSPQMDDLLLLSKETWSRKQ